MKSGTLLAACPHHGTNCLFLDSQNLGCSDETQAQEVIPKTSDSSLPFSKDFKDTSSLLTTKTQNSERLSNFFKVTQLKRSRAKIQMQMSDSEDDGFSPLHSSAQRA